MSYSTFSNIFPFTDVVDDVGVDEREMENKFVGTKIYKYLKIALTLYSSSTTQQIYTQTTQSRSLYFSIPMGF